LVTVTDANGCSDQATVTVNQSSGLAVSASINTPIACNGGTALVDVVASGGTAPYTYNWSNGHTTKDLQQLSAGIFTVTVTDVNGCSSTLNSQLVFTSNLNIQSTSGNTNCAGLNSGWINTIVSGGIAPYSILWNNGATQNNISLLSPGTYTVTYTDILGCSVQSTSIITNTSDSIDINFTTIDVKCYGDSSGSISTIINGGLLPYTYLWSNNTTGQTISNLKTGVYSLTVTDANGCAVTKSVSISQPLNPVDATASLFHVNCHGEHTGRIELFPSGGLGNYVYQWNNGSNTKNIDQLAAGQYSVTIKDQNGCEAIRSFNINEPDSVLEVIISSNTNPCAGTPSLLTAIASGGTQPYSYAWNNGITTNATSSIGNSNYIVTITDSNGCSISKS